MMNNQNFLPRALILITVLTVQFGFASPAFTQEATHSFLVDLNSKKVTELNVSGGHDAHATSINDAGQMAGFYVPENVPYRPESFITGPNGVGTKEIFTLRGAWSETEGINNAVQVAGESLTPRGESHAFITGPNGVVLFDLNSIANVPTGVVLTHAYDINNNGQVIAIGIVPKPEAYAVTGGPRLGFLRDTAANHFISRHCLNRYCPAKRIA
jgi:uncharacterized membrane protein